MIRVGRLRGNVDAMVRKMIGAMMDLLVMLLLHLVIYGRMSDSLGGGSSVLQCLALLVGDCLLGSSIGGSSKDLETIAGVGVNAGGIMMLVRRRWLVLPI